MNTQASIPQDRAVDFIELSQIRVLDQVRTEFDEQSIDELAESLKIHGMLQPVLLRASEDFGYIVIAGERRIRAAHRAGLTHVPALVGQVDDDKAAEMQIVENIQREELSLADTAKGVLQLYERNKTLSAVGKIVGKSVPWVSKHIAAATNLGWNTKNWFEDPETKCEDLELVLTINQMEKLGKWYPRVESLLQRIDEGTAGRPEARELLQTMRDEISAERKAKATPKQANLTDEQQEPEEPVWNAHTELQDLHDKLNEQYEAIDQVPTSDLVKHLDKAQLAEMVKLLRPHFDEGKKLAKRTEREKARLIMSRCENGYGGVEWADMAWMIGMYGEKLTFPSVVDELREYIRTDNA